LFLTLCQEVEDDQGDEDAYREEQLLHWWRMAQRFHVRNGS
jgi:hypothetical protein